MLPPTSWMMMAVVGLAVVVVMMKRKTKARWDRPLPDRHHVRVRPTSDAVTRYYMRVFADLIPVVVYSCHTIDSRCCCVFLRGSSSS